MDTQLVNGGFIYIIAAYCNLGQRLRPDLCFLAISLARNCWAEGSHRYDIQPRYVHQMR